jgi:hypothetical protein
LQALDDVGECWVPVNGARASSEWVGYPETYLSKHAPGCEMWPHEHCGWLVCVERGDSGGRKGVAFRVRLCSVVVVLLLLSPAHMERTNAWRRAGQASMTAAGVDGTQKLSEDN